MGRWFNLFCVRTRMKLAPILQRVHVHEIQKPVSHLASQLANFVAVLSSFRFARERAFIYIKILDMFAA